MTKIVALFALLLGLGLVLLEHSTRPEDGGFTVEIALPVPEHTMPHDEKWGFRFSLGLLGTPLAMHHETKLSSDSHGPNPKLRLVAHSLLGPP